MGSAPGVAEPGLVEPEPVEPGGGGSVTQPCGGGAKKVGGVCGSRVGATTAVPQRAQNRAPLTTDSPQEMQNIRIDSDPQNIPSLAEGGGTHISG